MDELYKIAVQYHRQLHSFHAYGGFREPYMYLFLFSAVACMVAAVAMIISAGSNESSLLSFGFVALFFLMLILLHGARDKLLEQRDERLWRDCARPRGRSGESVRVCLLEEAFHCDRSRFLDLAQSIRRSIEIEEAYNRRDRSFGEWFIAFVSLPKSSSTLLALFAILATVVTLAGKTELSLSDFFAIIAEAGQAIFSLSAVFVLSVAVLVAAFRFYLRELSRVWTFLALAHQSDDAKSLSAVRNLARDLNRFHAWAAPEPAQEPAQEPAWKARVRRGLRRRR
jgi:ABC-type multidrug transport system fused ATPase/permease subunit